MRNLLLVLLVLASGWLVIEWFQGQQQPLPTLGEVVELGPADVPPYRVVEAPAAAVPLPDSETPNRVADISVHSVAEMEQLFTRVEQVLDRPRSDGEQPLISLVLHGPEVEFFALKNYTQYKSIVDRAAKLAALGAVTISICRTQMSNYGIAPDGVPGFLHQVPFGPDEVERLVNEGYVYM